MLLVARRSRFSFRRPCAALLCCAVVVLLCCCEVSSLLAYGCLFCCQLSSAQPRLLAVRIRLMALFASSLRLLVHCGRFASLVCDMRMESHRYDTIGAVRPICNSGKGSEAIQLIAVLYEYSY